VVEQVAHELMHSQKGWYGTIYEGNLYGVEEAHDRIYTKASKIRTEYLNWLEEQSK
jgi:hypothetical protein